MLPSSTGFQFPSMFLFEVTNGKNAFEPAAANFGRYMFGDEFRQYIESDLLKRQPHPEAKPMGAFSLAGGRDD